jgi:hypothetical protein
MAMLMVAQRALEAVQAIAHELRRIADALEKERR